MDEVIGTHKRYRVWMGRRRWSDILRDPVLVVGTVTSIILGIIFYERSDARTALGVLAGLVGVVISLQIQAILLSQKKLEDATRYTRIENVFDEIEWLAPVAEDIVEKTASINSHLVGTPGIALCQQIINECRGRLTDLQRGHYEPIYGDQSVFHNLTESVSVSMRATSAQGVDLSWWSSTRSQEYWRLQQEAMRRKVDITRIFIYFDWTPDLDRLASVQHAAGVRVRRVHRDHLAADLNTDIVVWDESCGYETRSNAAGEPVLNFFTFDSQDTRTMVAKFNRVLAVAEAYVPEVRAP